MSAWRNVKTLPAEKYSNSNIRHIWATKSNAGSNPAALTNLMAARLAVGRVAKWVQGPSAIIHFHRTGPARTGYKASRESDNHEPESPMPEIRTGSGGNNLASRDDFKATAKSSQTERGSA